MSVSEPLRRRNWLRAAAYLAPFLVGTAVFTVYPLLYVVVVSFQEHYNMLTRGFARYGLDNYATILSEADFASAVRNTAIFTAVTVPMSLILGLPLASMLASVRFLKGFYQTAFFLPLVTSSVAVGMVWKYIFNADFGLLNYLLSLFGAPTVNWLNDPDWNMPAILIFGVWSSLPFTIMIFVAALQSISENNYTAARVDGASLVQRFFRITVPLMGPTIALVAILNLITASKVFSELFPLFNGRPGAGYSLYTMVYYIYEKLQLEGDLGQAAATSLVLFAVVLLLTVAQVLIRRRHKVQP